MALHRLLFGVLYRIGFTPWDGHALPARLGELVGELPKGKALDIGCGTGDTSIHLAKHGWDVTAVDFVEAALARAKKKSAQAGADVRFVQADVTRLGSYGVGDGFSLLVDNGCMHGFPDPARDAYVREVEAVAGAGATLFLVAFPARKRRGPRGIDRAEIEERFARWELRASGIAGEVSNLPGDPIHFYELRRR